MSTFPPVLETFGCDPHLGLEVSPEEHLQTFNKCHSIIYSVKRTRTRQDILRIQRSGFLLGQVVVTILHLFVCLRCNITQNQVGVVVPFQSFLECKMTTTTFIAFRSWQHSHSLSAVQQQVLVPGDAGILHTHRNVNVAVVVELFPSPEWLYSN